MNRLSALDALFLYMETPQTPMQVGSVTIFKPSSLEDDLFARFRDHTSARLDLLPSYRRRLESTPLGIDHPVWVVDDKLDLDYHIRHAALPKPGSMAQLRDLVAQLHAIPLDHSRPLWEYYFIEGLEGGAFAVYIKVHHSAMDGMAGMATLGVTYDFAPGAEHGARAASNRSSRRRAIRPHRADEHSGRRFRSPGLARRQVAARRRGGVDEGRAPFRPRCTLSVPLREGHAAHAVQQGDLRSSRLRDLFAPPAGGQGAGQIERRDH